MSTDGYKDKDSTIADEVAEKPVYRPEVDISTVDERKLIRKIDWHVVPWFAVLYLLSFLDRGSIGNARVCEVASLTRSLL